MTISHSLIYWISRLDPIISLAVFFGVVSGIVVFFATLFGMLECSGFYKDDPRTPKTIKTIKLALAAFAVSNVIAVFTPTTKQMAAIIVIPAIANSKELSTLSGDAGDIYRMGVDSIKEWLSEKNQKGE